METAQFNKVFYFNIIVTLNNIFFYLPVISLLLIGAISEIVIFIL